MASAVSAWRSLKTRITLGLLAIFLTGLWSLALYSSQTLRSNMQRILGEQQLATISVMAGEIDDELNSRLQKLEALAVQISPLLLRRQGDLPQILSQQEWLSSGLFNGGIRVVGRDGKALAGSRLPSWRPSVDAPQLDSVAAALGGAPGVGLVLLDAGQDAQAITVSVPVFGGSGEVTGAVTGVVQLNKPNFIDRILQTGARSQSNYLLVAPSARRVIAATDPRWRLWSLPVASDVLAIGPYVAGFEVTQVLDGAVGVEVLKSNRKISWGGWHVAAWTPTETVFAPIGDMQQRMLLAALALTLFAALLSWALLRWQFKPLLNAVQRVAERSRAGSSVLTLPIEKSDEVGELIGAFNGLLESLAKRQTELQDSEERFRSLVEWSPEAITVHRDGVRLYANPAMLRLMGVRSADEVVGKSIFEWIHPEDVAALDPRGDLFTAVDSSLPYTEARFIKTDGSMLQVELHRTAIRFGGQSAVLTVLRDVTARKLADSQLRQLSLAVEQSPESIVITDAEGRVEYVNDAFVQSSGYGRGLVLGRSMSLLHSGRTPSQTYSDLWATLTQGRVWSGEFVNRRRDGSDYFERAIISPLRQDDGRITHYVAVQQDITQARRVDEELAQHRHHLQDLVTQRTAELAQARQVAEQANKAKSHFLAAASHDLRQPLSALSLYVGVLRERVPPQTLDLVLSIQDCVDSLSELLNDLLDVSKLDAGVVVPRLSDFAIADLMGPLMSIHSAKARMKGLRLRWRHSDAFAHCDLPLLRRILGNLIDNAIKYTREGGVLVACRRREGRQWMEVWDTGLGIPDDKTEVIFEEFTQLDEARTRGSGLGLTIVARTAALLGLRVRLRSRPGRGSVFAIELPLGRISLSGQRQAATPGQGRLTVAVVDDNARVLRALVMALDSLGHTVIAGTSANELLDNLDGQTPDLVISDYRLAEQETGFDVIRRLRDHLGQPGGKPLPAIIVTGDTDPALIRSMAMHGIQVRYKPLQLDSLQAFVDASRTSAEVAVAHAVS